MWSSAFRRAPPENSRAPDTGWCADTKVVLSRGTTAFRLDVPPLDAQADHVPLCVLLHDLTNSSYIWKDLADLLTNVHTGPPARVLVMDFYGHGRSPYVKGIACTMEVFVNQLHELVEAIGILDEGIPFMLIGQGMGASVAAGFMAKHPDLVKSLCLVAPLGVAWSSGSPLQEHLLRRRVFGRILWRWKMRHFFAAAFKQFIFGRVDENAKHAHLVELEGNMLQWQIQNTPGFIEGIESTLKNFPLFKDKLTSLLIALGQHPGRSTCCLWGQRDPLCPPERGGSVVRECFSHEGLLHKVADAGHFPLIENFDYSADAILSFIAESARELRRELTKPA